MSDIAWMAAALGSTLVYTGVSISDKVILSRYRLRLRAFNFFVGFSQLSVALIVLAAHPLRAPSLETALAGVGVGALWGVGLLFIFAILQREEVSRVQPVFQSYPILVALMAVGLLGETLTPAKWLAVLLATGGAALVSAHRSEIGGEFKPRPGLFFLLVAAQFAASAQILLKTVSDDLDVWHRMALRGIGLALVMSVPTFSPAVVRELAGFFSRGKRGLVLFGTETVGATTGNVLLIYAIGVGPVSLATAILGTRPVFVFFATVGVALLAKGLLSEQLDRTEVTLKLAAAVMVAAALALIAVG